MGIEDQLASYQSAHPDVTIALKTTDFGAHHAALPQALRSDSAPDVVAVERSYLPGFKADPAKFVDLRRFGAGELAKDYLPWRWAQGVAADGAVLGLPTDAGGKLVCYRKDLFAKAGLPSDRDKVSALWPTWEAFVATGERYAAGIKDPKLRFVDNAASVFGAMVDQGDEAFYDRSYRPSYATNPAVRKAWDVAASAARKNLTAHVPAFSPAWNAGLTSGAFAVSLCPWWQQDAIGRQVPKATGVWDLTALPGTGGGNAGGTQLMIPAKAAHPDQAYALISWLESAPQQSALFAARGNFPTITSLYAGAAVIGAKAPFFGDAPRGRLLAASVSALTPVTEGPDQGVIYGGFADGLARVEQGTQTPEAAWNQTLADLEKKIVT
jgi:cellobiose transport system substrate-binding protein